MRSRYPKWTHDKYCHEIDPINLIFANASSNKILTHLHKTGWKDPGVSHKQFLKDSYHSTLCIKPQNMDKMHGHWLRRFHVRIWQWGDEQVGSTHYETGRFFWHVVHHFEGAEEKVADDFSVSNQWAVTKDKHNLRNRELERYNNGLATEIKEI